MPRGTHLFAIAMGPARSHKYKRIIINIAGGSEQTTLPVRFTVPCRAPRLLHRLTLAMDPCFRDKDRQSMKQKALPGHHTEGLNGWTVGDPRAPFPKMYYTMLCVV